MKKKNKPSIEKIDTIDIILYKNAPQSLLRVSVESRVDKSLSTSIQTLFEKSTGF